MRVIVVGGTGRTGRLLMEALRGKGHEAVAASPSIGVDTISRAGLDAALAGADVVVDVTDSPTRDEAKATEFFRVSGRNQADAERRAGVRHHVALSIIGLERASELAYYRAKLTQEAAVKGAGVRYTIVRAAQFYEFMDVLLQANMTGDRVRLASVRVQPIALADLVEMLVEVVEGEPVDATVEAAGPQVLALDEIGRRLTPPGVRVTSDGRPFFGADIPVDALLAGPGARLGGTTLDQWREQTER